MIRLLRILLLPALLVAASSALAQEEEQRHQLYNGADTLLYTYTPIESDSLMVADTVADGSITVYDEVKGWRRIDPSPADTSKYPL